MSQLRATAVAASALLALGVARAGAQLTDLGAEQLVECLSLGDCGQDDAFGSAMASGDFDDDGFADLAVGVPGEKVGTHPGAGSVHVFYGSRGGLRMADASDQIFDQSTSGVLGGPEDDDHFGAALAVGDFDGDGIDDLAIGVPDEDLGTLANAGTVTILFGSAGGLTASGSLSISQDTFTSSESAEAGDRFGASLAAGPQGFGFDVLAVGVPGEDLGVLDTKEGQVDILSSVGGVPLQGMAIRQQVDSCDGGGLSEAGDRFGTALGFRPKGSTGDYLAGTPLETLHGVDSAGCVDFIGSNVCWSEDSTIDGSTAFDLFGSAVISGDFDGNGRQDMGVGAPGRFGDGRVWAFYANSGGAIDNGAFEQIGQFDFPDTDSESDSFFGSALASGDFDGDGFDDLAMSAPYKTISSHDNAGEVNVLYGSANGLVPVTHQQTFNESFPAGMPGTPQGNGTFGYAMASGDFDGNGTADLAIGAPGEDFSSFADTGTVTVLYGLDRSTGAFGTVAFGATGVTVSEPSTSTPVNIAIGRFGSAVVDASVDYALAAGGTATQNADFTFTPGTKTWSAGSTVARIFSVTILPDTLDEGNETIKVQLANPTAGTALGSPKTFTITIQDDDVGGKVKFHTSTFSVGEKGGMAVIQVDRTDGAASDVTVHYATSNGTAVATKDYTATSGTLTFGADQASATFQVPILDDGAPEADETVNLTLSAVGGGGLLAPPSTAILTIVDNEVLLHGDGFETGGLTRWSGHS